MKSVVSSIFETTIRMQDKRAIQDETGCISYRELRENALRVSAKLIEMGLKSGEIVGIEMPRCKEYVMAMLGVWFAGGAVLVLDSDYPKERLDFIKNDCHPKVVITTSFISDCRCVEPAQNYIDVSENTLAYIIYTSGSTGKPKGISHTLKSISLSCYRLLKYTGITETEIYGISLPFTFAACLGDLMIALTAGTTLVIISDVVRKDVSLLSDFLYNNHISTVFMNPRMLRQLKIKGDSLKLVMIAGEKAADVFTDKCRIINIYGSSETVGPICAFTLDKVYSNTPIGLPQEGIQVYLLDEHGKIADEGEICATGCLANGYINLPEQTAKAFVPNPFKALDGFETMFHTNDIGRRLPDGNIVYLNRKDWMFKVNGQRVEPGEVEAVLNALPEIRECSVKGFENPKSAFLCAYYVENSSVSRDYLRRELAKRLPAYMIPLFFIRLDSLPRNLNGKLDYKSLKAPEIGQFKSQYAAPTNEIELAICKGFESVLEIDDIGIDDDFFSMGGDSIKTVLLSESCSQYKISSLDILNGKTPREIAKLVNQTKNDDYSSISPDIVCATLSDSQMGVYLECMQIPNALMYNNPVCYRFADNHIVAEKLESAIKLVIDGHCAFKLRVESNKGIPCLIRDESIVDNIHIINMKEEDVLSYKSSFVRAFDLNHGPLYRFEIIKTEAAVWLFFDMHHIVYDGSSFSILKRDISSAYQSQKIAREEISPLMVAKYEEINGTSESYKKAYSYFESKLSGVEVNSNLLNDTPDALANNKTQRLFYQTSVSAEDIDKYTQMNGLTVNTVFMGSFGYALAKFTGQNESLFCSVNNGRHSSKLKNTIGMFVKTLPIYIKIDEDDAPEDYLRPLQDDFFNCIRNDHASFVKMSSELGVKSDIIFVYQAELFHGLELDGITTDAISLETGEAIANIAFQVFKSGNEYWFQIDYKSCMYLESTIQCLAEMVENIVNGMMKFASLKQIPLISERVRKQLDAFNQTEVAYDKSKSIVDLLLEQVKKQPDSTAVVYKDKKISYRDFWDKTDRIASYIHQKGIGKDDFVPILIGRNEFMPITAWGVVKSGAAYQPLDPSYPQERLNFMVKDSGAKLLIADRELRIILSEYKGEVLYTDEIDQLPESSAMIEPPKADNALIIIYTSGTTGVPKGCVIEHKNVVAFHVMHRQTMQLTEKSRVASYASFGFDAGLMDIFTTLSAGAQLHILDDEIRLDMVALEDYYVKNEITCGFMTTQVGRLFVANTKCKTLKRFMVGGEKLIPFIPPQNIDFINGYGPSETVCYVSHHFVEDDSKLQPVGGANINTKLYVIDKNMNRLPNGACGELCIAGPQVSRGYLNCPDKTAEVFVSNPFCSDPDYSRIYKTGDIVRMLSNGEIDFVGRRDGQVKIRGFRIELTEVEKVIQEFPGIKNTAVTAFDAPSGGKYLAAYIVSDDKVDIHELNEFILETKPPYMVPAATVQIDSIPINVNGKVDKKKLPKPEIHFEDIIPPQTDNQRRIFNIVSQIIGTDKFGIKTDIFEAGLTSIGSIKLNALLAEAFNVPIQTRNLRENSTIEKLEKFLINAVQCDELDVLDDYPLTKTQEGILFECMAHPDSTLYNIPVLLKIDDSIDIQRLKHAIVDVVNAHSYVMMTLFVDKSGDIRQNRSQLKPFTESDIEEIQTENINKLELVQPYHLIGDRLFHIKLIHADAFYFFVDMHHIISDGTTMNIFLRDISLAYRGDKIEPEVLNGFELALIEQKKRNTDALTKARTYYEKLIDGLDCDFLPKGDQKPSMIKKSHSVRIFSDFELVEKTRLYCEEYKVGINALMCAAFGYVLSLYNGSEYSLFTTIYHGRNDSRMLNTASMLVKTLPMVCQFKGLSTLEYVKNVSSQLIDSMANDIYSFAEISRELGVKSDVMFVYQGDSFGFESFCDKPACLSQIELSEQKFPLLIQATIVLNQFCFEISYDSSRYTEKYIQAFASALKTAISRFMHCNKVEDVTLVDDEAAGILDAFNETEVAFDRTKSIVELLREQVDAHPDNIAVVYKGKRISYHDFWDKTDRIASYIHSKNIGKDDFVAILIGRNEFMPITAWGVVKSGAAYQPLDPTYPQERLNFMVHDSSAKLLIADREYRSLLTDYHGDVLFTDEIEALPDALCEIEPAALEDAFIILYTSGTTGVPKGSILEHKNILAFNFAHCHLLQISPDSRVASYASFGFDACLMDFYATLTSGAQLHILEEDIRLDMDALDNYYIQNQITCGFMTTQVGCMFISNTKCKTLKLFSVGGEQLIPVIPPENVQFVNLYGPSETTCYITRHIVNDDSILQPIGSANTNTKLYVVDKNMHRLPIGACGELCIAGHQVSRGYLNRPDKTAEVFVSNPFCSDPDYSRIYKTGDIVRMLSNGEIDFIGRRDGQVKIRGFRIELTEVEKVIKEYPGIINAVVTAFDAPSGGKYLAAYIISDEKIDIRKLNEFILKTKPPYMVPAATVQIECIPYTVNGKVDKKKLPKPDMRVQKTGLNPSTALEIKLCDIFRMVLGLDVVYADDDFFEIGGTSITASKLVLNCMNAGISIVYKNVFDHSTPQRLAAFIENGSSNTPVAHSKSVSQNLSSEYSPLDYNVNENLKKIQYCDPGIILLTGGTGFLGVHVLKEILDVTRHSVLCLLRSKKNQPAAARVKNMLFYYFGKNLPDEYYDRIEVIEGDITDSTLDEKLQKYQFDTIINCAACVKHFAQDDSIERINYGGVLNLIKIAQKRNVRLIQTSTLSVAGESIAESVPEYVKLCENVLNIGQNLDNKYIHSKYMAEDAMIKAIAGGMRGKILRMGNLMGRTNDGEFQINFQTNGFMRQIKGYKKLGCFPVDNLDAPVEFSPIDCCAKACLLLVGTPDEFTVFNVNNCHIIHMANIIKVLNSLEMNVNIVNEDEFKHRFMDMLADDNSNQDISGLIAYMNNAGESRRMIESDNHFTVKALYRLGFDWPIIDLNYVKNAIEAVSSLGFFD